MLSYYLKCRKNAGSKNPKFVKTKNERVMLFSKGAKCDNKKVKIYQRARSQQIIK